MHTKYIAQIFLAVIIWIMLAMFLTSCNTAQRATRQVNKALFFHPEVVAKIARSAFPCIVNKSDTAIVQYDTTIIADCPEVNNYIPFNPLDTLFLLPSLPQIVKVPVVVKIPGRTITRTVEDSAKIKVMQSEIDTLTSDKETLQKSNRNKNKWLLYFGLFGLLNIAIYAYKIFVK